MWSIFGLHLRWICLRLELGAGDAAILTWAFQMTEKTSGVLQGGESSFANIQRTSYPTTETLALRVMVRSGHRRGWKEVLQHLLYAPKIA